MGRPSWVRLTVAAVVLAPLAACGDGDSQASTPDDVVPFERRPAAVPDIEVEEETAGPEVPECKADLVTFEVVTEGEVLGSDPGSGSLAAPENRPVALMARPGERCGLSTWPSLRLTASEGRPDVLTPEFPPRTERLLLTGRQRIVGLVQWRSSCAPPGAEVGIEATLAGGDTVWAPLGDRPGCDPGAQNTGGFFMAFPVLSPDSPLEAELVGVPPTAPFAGTLEVVVELSNPGAEPVSLDPCPVYHLGYGESGTSVGTTNQLNCSAARGDIPAGGRLRFAAELELLPEEITRGFVGTVGVSVYLDDVHGPAQASAELTTA